MGNGLTVWNRSQLEDGDYKIIAHIAPDRTVKFYVDDLPKEIQARINHIAATSTMTISATQDAPVFSTPPLEQEPDRDPNHQPRDVPYIFCEWSDSAAFQEKAAYSISEFDQLMKQADDKYTAGAAAAMKKYGTWQKWHDADDPEFQAFLTYDKVKFTIVMPDGRTFTERQDVGDGDGGVLNFLSKYPAYNEIVPILREAARQEAEGAQKQQESPPPEQALTSGRFWDDYNSIKERHPDSLVLYQVGDFFELYGGSPGEDANSAASTLGLILTTRVIPDIGRVSMCGFPVHELGDRVDRLNGQGFNVIVAAQEGAQHKTSFFSAPSMADDFSDIDPTAVRTALAERGIVDGHVADPDKLENSPFVQMVILMTAL